MNGRNGDWNDPRILESPWEYEDYLEVMQAMAEPLEYIPPPAYLTQAPEKEVELVGTNT